MEVADQLGDSINGSEVGFMIVTYATRRTSVLKTEGVFKNQSQSFEEHPLPEGHLH